MPPGIVYHTDISAARETLRKIMDMDADWVLPSHAGLLTKEEASELAEVNLKGLDRLQQLALGALGGVSTEDVVCSVSDGLKLTDRFNLHLVCETTVRAFLHALHAEGAIDYELKGHRVLWHVK